MSEELLSGSAIAKRLGLPDSTARYYAAKFADFLPTAGTGRRRRYRAESLEVLRFVADQFREGVSSELIEAALVERFPMNATQQQDPQVSQDRRLQTTTTQQQSLEDIRASVSEPILAELADLRERLTAITATLEQQQLNNEALKAELLEAIAAGQKQNGRHWWQVWRR